MAPGTGLGLVEDGLVASRDGLIVYAGPSPGALTTEALEIIDCEGRWITPGLIDCHTHLVYAGNRAHEFEQRLAGATSNPSPARAAASFPPSTPRGPRVKLISWRKPCRASMPCSPKA